MVRALLKTCVLFIFSLNAFSASYQAVIQVLEAPIFHKEDQNSKIFDHYRKGKVIDIYTYDSDVFHKTVDQRGRVSFILQDHVHVFYEDQRENLQEKISFDPTDYRIKEPLPKKFPFITPHKYKAFMAFGFSKPDDQIYPVQRVQDETQNFGYKVLFSFSKLLEREKTKRTYYGIDLQHEGYTNEYINENKVIFYERTNKVLIGPHINHDLYQSNNYAFNIHLSLLFNLYYTKDISSYDINGTYTSSFLSSYSSFKFSKMDIFEGTDFIIGGDFLFDPPHTLKSSDDKYSSRFNTSFSFFLGLQKRY